jgi:hypothetical protein
MSDRRQTFPKTIRLTREELERVQDLLPHFPEASTEAELLRQATLLGLQVLAAQAPDLAGYAPAHLASLLRYRLVGALDLLIDQQALPALHRLIAEREQRAALIAREGEAETEEAPPIDEVVAEELSELGTDFLD